MVRASRAERVGSTTAERPAPLSTDLDRLARWGLWALPVWSVLLFLSTLTHQPDPETAFGEFARYVTTTQFRVSHIGASIFGAGIGVLGLFALFLFLALRMRSTLATVGLALSVVGNVVSTAIFGTAAFGQPAAGRLYLAGQTDDAQTVYNDMYDVPLFATAAAGLLMLVIGVVMLGIVVSRSRLLPRWAGIILAVGICVFGVLGVMVGGIVQSIGAVLLIVSSLALALNAPQSPAQAPLRHDTEQR